MGSNRAHLHSLSPPSNSYAGITLSHKASLHEPSSVGTPDPHTGSCSSHFLERAVSPFFHTLLLCTCSLPAPGPAQKSSPMGNSSCPIEWSISTSFSTVNVPLSYHLVPHLHCVIGTARSSPCCKKPVQYSAYGTNSN